jgi:hypothetical protein
VFSGGGSLDIAELIAKAGGSPWEINRTLRAGSPWQIDNLANTFHDAGRCTAFRRRIRPGQEAFDAAWNHQDGDHPINDSAEVQWVTKGLGSEFLQLAKIDADLEDIAAALAEAQKQGATESEALNYQLQVLDEVAVAAQKGLEDSTPDEKSRQALWNLIEDAKAVTTTFTVTPGRRHRIARRELRQSDRLP